MGKKKRERRVDTTELTYEVEGLKKSMKHMYDSFEVLLVKFDGVVDKLESQKQPLDFKTTIYVILSTIMITSSTFAAASWMINSEMDVPLEQIRVAKSEISLNTEELSNSHKDLQILVNIVQGLAAKVKDNTEFVNQYMYIDKVPVAEENQNGRLSSLEMQMNRLTDAIHSGKLRRKD